jgi:hypothetical protein
LAIADVDALVKKDAAVDVHARTNTTSVYTSALPNEPDGKAPVERGFIDFALPH